MFVTLTYSDQYLPINDKGYETLKKTDLQAFINLLRQYAPFRYFAIGEYGDKGQRPHYHIIIFNFFPVVDPKENHIIYHKDWSKITSQSLMSNVDIEAVIYKAWKKGKVQVENVTAGAIGYVANYTVDPSVREHEDIQAKIFAIMSKRPPIGHQYYQNKEIMRYHRYGKVEEMKDRFHYTNPDNGVIVHLPRMYRKKLYTDKEREKLNEMVQEDNIENLRKIKDVVKYSKNLYEAHEFENDKLNRRNPKRTI